MLKKRLGIEGIELDWARRFYYIYDYYKIPSTLIIPKGVKEIGDYAFCAPCDESKGSSSYYRLKKVVIPDGCKCVGREAFYSCIGLRKVEIPESVEMIGEEAFYDCSKAEVIVDKFEEDFKYIGNYAFSWCKSVRYVKEKARN